MFSLVCNHLEIRIVIFLLLYETSISAEGVGQPCFYSSPHWLLLFRFFAASIVSPTRLEEEGGLSRVLIGRYNEILHTGPF